MDDLKKKNNLFDKLCSMFIFLSMSIMVILVFGNALLRYLFNSGFPQSEELARYFFIWVSFLGAIIALKNNQHVGATFFIDKISGRKKIFVQIIGELLILIALIVVTWGGIQFFEITAVSESPATGMPFGVISILIVITPIAMGIYTIVNLIRVIRLIKEET
ncbi:MAG: TRAP transporter small permease [Clostridia bacterium]|nr:TRAP transporter small permease [Clostridia bacterium]